MALGIGPGRPGVPFDFAFSLFPAFGPQQLLASLPPECAPRPPSTSSPCPCPGPILFAPSHCLPSMPAEPAAVESSGCTDRMTSLLRNYLYAIRAPARPVGPGPWVFILFLECHQLLPTSGCLQRLCCRPVALDLPDSCPSSRSQPAEPLPKSPPPPSRNTHIGSCFLPSGHQGLRETISVGSVGPWSPASRTHGTHLPQEGRGLIQLVILTALLPSGPKRVWAIGVYAGSP